MCLILIAHDVDARHRLVVAANRDEFYDREASAAGWWPDAPGLLGGRDLRAGGSWMGVTRGGRFAAVTNVRDFSRLVADAPSRGHLVADYLTGGLEPEAYLERLLPRADAYSGFNLVLGDGRALWWYSNHARAPVRLEPGVYGVSNHLLDTPWPKVEGGKRALREVLAANDAAPADALLSLLADRTLADDAALPDTGIGVQMERALSPRFIATPGYGTRASTVLLVGRDGGATLLERGFRAGGAEWTDVRHDFALDAAPAVGSAR